MTLRPLLPLLLCLALPAAGCGSEDSAGALAPAQAASPPVTATATAPQATTATEQAPAPATQKAAARDEERAPEARAAARTSTPTPKTASPPRKAARVPARENADEAPVNRAPTDAEIRAELREAYGGEAGVDLDVASLSSDGTAIIPQTAPRKLAALMQGANEVARKPYVYGGGHGRNPNEIWSDSAYDCSGSVSYALAAAGYIDGPMDSSSLARWGKPGPGKWVTIYANAEHAFMVVAGLRYDTSGRQRTGTRWQPADARSYAGFTVRHPPGL